MGKLRKAKSPCGTLVSSFLPFHDANGTHTHTPRKEEEGMDATCTLIYLLNYTCIYTYSSSDGSFGSGGGGPGGGGERVTIIPG